jgi:hypothetical protein
MQCSLQETMIQAKQDLSGQMENPNRIFQAKLHEAIESPGRAMPRNRVLLLGSRWARNFVRRAFPRNAHAVQCPSNF